MIACLLADASVWTSDCVTVITSDCQRRPIKRRNDALLVNLRPQQRPTPEVNCAVRMHPRRGIVAGLDTGDGRPRAVEGLGDVVPVPTRGMNMSQKDPEPGSN